VKAVKTGLIHPDEPVLVINTGNGLKDVKSAMRAAGEAPVIEPTMTDLKKLLEKSGTKS
jgi:threonine synthase